MMLLVRVGLVAAVLLAGGAVLRTSKAEVLSPAPSPSPAPTPLTTPPAPEPTPGIFLSPDYPTYSPPTRPRLGAPPLPPDIVLDWIEAHMDGCRGYGPDLKEGEAPAGNEEEPTLVYRTRVNGLPALVTSISALPVNCGYSGSAGSPLAVFVKLPRHDWRIAFDSGIAVQGHEWKRKGGKDLLYLGLHGGYCGGAGVDECWSLMEFDGSAFVEIDRHKNYDCPDGPRGRFGPAEVCESGLQPDALPSGEPHSSDPPPGTIVAPKEMRDAWERAQERQRQQWNQ